MKKKSGIISFIAGSLLLILFGISVFVLWKQAKSSTDVVIAQDVAQLQKIFEDIHRDCGIVDFEHTKNYIDFLTVKEFVGSEVGAMNLLHPTNWKGPYVQNNPTIQEKEYIILRTEKGYFIVPGEGVALGNGKIVGKDFGLNENADVQKWLGDHNKLYSQFGALGAKIEVGVGPIRQVLSTPMRYLE